MAAQVLIVGAGPTGLAAALFLTLRGVEVRIIDKMAEPSTTSKALAVNPRTLDLLEPTGVSARIESEGRTVRSMTMLRAGRRVARMDFEELSPAWRMIALPQARTEALLTEALADNGVRPERGTTLQGLSQNNEGVTALVVSRNGAETICTPILFAADGARSTVREALGVPFPGSSLPETWRLVDVEFKAPVDAPEGYVDLRPGGIVFAMMFVPTRWRIISSVGDPMDALPHGAQVKDVPWRSDFRISHRIAERLSVGRVCLGGDAAHLHSPMGARGMNLGVEDAYVFAALAAEALKMGTADRLADYGRLRHAADGAVVRRVETLTRLVRGRGIWALLRAVAPMAASRSATARRAMARVAAGLDHPVRLS